MTVTLALLFRTPGQGYITASRPSLNTIIKPTKRMTSQARFEPSRAMKGAPKTEPQEPNTI